MTTATAQSLPIAIVGVSALFPGSSDATGFWRDILAGRDLIGDVPATHWRIDDYYDPDPAAPDKTYARRGGFLGPVDFDALGWGVPPSTLPATDTSQLLALIVAQAVLKDAAREQFDTMDRSRISVILGVTSAQELLFSMVSRLQKPVWVKALRETGIPEDEVQAACARIAANYVPWQEASFPGLLGNVVAGRIANRLNLGGTNCVTDAACASSLSALAMAVGELQLGHSDLAIAGGVDTLNDIFMYMCFSKTPALSPSGDCRPFSDQADGTMLGEGLGMVALKRLADAERDGDRIYAVLRGLGTASDGRSKSVYAPVSAGQAQALRRAYEAAGYGPETVELVEAHGTGTKAGDVAEFEGLRSVYAPADPDRVQWCALGSVKSQIGHTKAAAGAAGLFKAVMALHHKVLPPTIKIERPDPRLAIEDSPFYLNTRARPWIRSSDHPRRAAVSAFGFGGSNFHVTLEEYDGPAPRAERLPTQSCELVLLQADDVAGLIAQAEAMLRSELPLANLAHASRQGWDASAPRRVALVASEMDVLKGRLRDVIARLRSVPEAAFALPDGSSYGIGALAGKVALLFPGQGSQYLEMGAALAMQFDAARRVWDRTADTSNLWERAPPAIEVPDAGPSRAEPAPTGARASRAEPAPTGARASRAEPAPTGAGASRAEPAPTGARASRAEPAPTGGARRLHEVVFPRRTFSADEDAASRATLTATEWAQPALAAHSLALLAVLRDLGVDADMCAGHSFGELTALHAAGVFDADATLAMARARGEAMRDAARLPGAMTALSEPIERVRELLAAHADVVVANHNGPRQVVVSGPLDAIVRLESELADARIGYTRLPVASAFHSRVVAEASEAFGHALAPVAIGQARMPVYANTTAAIYADDADALRRQLAQQLAQPVRFVEMIEAMHADGARVFVEIGPGQVLGGLVGAILGEREHQAIALDRKGRDGVESLLTGLARLAAAGVPMRPGRLYADVRLPAATAAKPKHAIAISGSNVGKPYPPVDGSSLPGPNPPRAPAPEADRRSRCEQGEPRDGPAPMSGSPLHGQPDLPHAHAHRTSDSEIDPMPATREIPSDWLTAFQEMQQQTAAAHESFQRAMADSHTAYLKLAETALGGLSALLQDQPVPRQASTIPARPVGIETATPIAPTLAAPVGAGSTRDASPVGAGSTRDASPVGAGSARDASTDTAGDRGQSPLPQDRPAHAAPSGAIDLPALLLAVVADKTGYPVDMLNLEMDLEGDLGIDSIKRVEILAAVDERAPELPKVDRARLGAMRTLAEIVAVLGPAAPVGAGSARDALTAAAGDRGRSPLPQGRAAYATPAENLGRFELEPVPAPPTGLAMPGLLAGEPLWILGHDAIGAALATELQQRGVRAQSAATLPDDATACVFLGGLRDFPDIDAAARLNFEAFALARQLAPRLQSAPGLFVTVQDTGGAFGLSTMDELRAWSAGLPALVKTCALEWPQAAVKAIDLARGDRGPAALASAIADELLAGGGEIEVALSADGARRTLRSVARPLQANAPAIEAGDVVIVSGGARGVTAACLVEWTQRCPAHFVLLGRTPLDEEPPACAGIHGEADLKRALLADARARGVTPTPAQLAARVHQVLAAREIRQTLAALIVAGASAQYRNVAVEDATALAKLLADVRAKAGPIRGVIHAAGVLADKRIAEKSDAQFAQVFDTKVGGLRALLDATSEDPLKLLAVFSSVSARCGNTGQADYAMANEVLAKVAAAEQRRRPGLRVKSLGWGPWEGGMVTPALRERFAALGVPMLPLAVGARMFADEISDAGALELILGGEPRPQALLSSGSDARVDALELRVDQASHAWLAGHAVAGVPVVLVAEWLARAVKSWRPGLHLVALHDLKVLKGIRLGGFGNGGDRLRIEARPLGARELALRVLGARGELHYSARAELGDPPAMVARGLPDVALGDWSGAPLYQDLLFHRGQFELIDRIDGISDDGIAARLRGVAAAAWPGEAWQIDAAALDGGLQLAVLYGQRMLGGPNLPTAIGELRSHAAPGPGPIRAVACSRRVGPAATTTDIYYSDASGQRFAELIGVQNHALPQ
jgi:acyl transferase domain-containing protein